MLDLLHAFLLSSILYIFSATFCYCFLLVVITIYSSLYIIFCYQYAFLFIYSLFESYFFQVVLSSLV